MDDPRILLQQCGAPAPLTTALHQLIGTMQTVDAIEKQSLSVYNFNGCSSNTTESDVGNILNDMKVLKKKRTRRKPRHKKQITNGELAKAVTDGEPQEERNSLDNLDFNFKILAISSQTTGSVFRVKNDASCKHINVNSFKKSLLKGNGAEILPCNSKVSVINDSFSKAFVQNGTAAERCSVSQVDNSNLQFSSSNLQGASLSSSPKGKQKAAKQRKSKKFLAYWSFIDVQVGLQSGSLIKGVLRINTKNYRDSYINNEDRSQPDYLIQTLADRNRALEGDVVAIKVKPETEWTEKQKTAYVVYILERVHSRTAVGFLHLMPDRNKQFALFVPRDCRVPRIKIPAHICPPSFHHQPHRYEGMLFSAKIVTWSHIKSPLGTLIENVGVMGDLESETAALLVEHDLDVSPFPPELLQSVSFIEGIPQEELAYREDLRKECVFTIDPLTARDLDDAVSCKELANGNLEIGVHISDVGYFLTQDTDLDRMVSRKATTIYLVNNVYHMLPKELCLHCSLLPGTDKLAFSVFWEMTRSGEIISHRFARTVINSCVQLAYEHAQIMIEDPNHEFEDGQLPQIYGGFTYGDLSRIINRLQIIAVNLRAKRFDSGALRIDQTKLLFRIDAESGEPTEYFVYENKDAHRLIEEFMLLANISVAQKLVEDFPDMAFLRCHEAPNKHLMSTLKKNLQAFKIDIDISSSKALQSSVWRIRDENRLDDSQMSVLQHLLAKPMMRAHYFCTANSESDEEYQHYALHVPVYTHFTSPIRRYADIMVHRLLAASLGYSELPNWNVDYVTDIVNNCNRQKYTSKCAGEASSEVYLAHYIAEHQPFIERALVVDVKNNSFDILVPATGTVLRMYPNAFGEDVQCVMSEETHKKFEVVFPESYEHQAEGYVIQLFAVLKVSLHRKPKSNKLEAKLLRPISSQSYVRQNSKRLE